jgi:hypothetical protein
VLECKLSPCKQQEAVICPMCAQSALLLGLLSRQSGKEQASALRHHMTRRHKFHAAVETILSAMRVRLQPVVQHMCTSGQPAKQVVQRTTTLAAVACICITNHFFSLTDTAASASAILLQRTTTLLHKRFFGKNPSSQLKGHLSRDAKHHPPATACLTYCCFLKAHKVTPCWQNSKCHTLQQITNTSTGRNRAIRTDPQIRPNQ